MPDENRVYFANVSVGNSITAVNNEASTHTHQFLVKRLVDTLDFREVLRLAGAIVVDEKPTTGDYVDLSPMMLDKTTILRLLTSDD